MTQLIIKEVRELFSSWLSVVVVGAFGILATLFLWVLPESNYEAYGYATTELFFDVGYYILLFVLPALAVGLFSSEYRHGTVETLSMMPQSWTQVVVSKYFSGLLVVLLILVCSFPVFYAIGDVAREPADDMGQIIGSSLGFLLIGGCYVAIAVAMSTIFENSSIAFITSIIVAFLMYSGIGYLADLPIWSSGMQYSIRSWSLSSHAVYLSRGVIGLSTIVYLLGVSFIFLLIAAWRLDTRQL